MQGTEELRQKLATACRLLYMEGLMDHAGLAGARIPETGNLLLNPREMRGTPGRHPGIMTAGDFVVVDPEGTKIEGENNPPSETPIFTGVFRARPDAMAVFHLHLPTATLFRSGSWAISSTGARPRSPHCASCAIWVIAR